GAGVDAAPGVLVRRHVRERAMLRGHDAVRRVAVRADVAEDEPVPHVDPDLAVEDGDALDQAALGAGVGVDVAEADAVAAEVPDLSVADHDLVAGGRAA